MFQILFLPLPPQLSTKFGMKLGGVPVCVWGGTVGGGVGVGGAFAFIRSKIIEIEVKQKELINVEGLNFSTMPGTVR